MTGTEEHPGHTPDCSHDGSHTHTRTSVAIFFFFLGRPLTSIVSLPQLPIIAYSPPFFTVFPFLFPIESPFLIPPFACI